MSLISDILPQGEPKVPMDDNAAQSSAAENPYLSIAIPQIQATFDTMYFAVRYLVDGKTASIKQIDKWLDEWEKKLEWVTKKYQELLGKFDELSGSLSAALTLDIAKEAWEILQDFPILRRYLGEANYWLLYDTVGLAATQGASLAYDVATAIKEALKAGIRALLAMTDGLLSIESYLGMISQYWGALYVKIIPLPLLDSIVPNVTCTYFFKPETPSRDIGVNNPVPGPGGFIPIPIPIPNPEYVAKYPLRSLAMDYNDPKTWKDPESGIPKFFNIDALSDALEYWGSSYFNETIPGITSAGSSIPAIYRRRSYIRDPEKGSEAHPLRIGNTFTQLDTSKTVVAYGGPTDASSEDDNSQALAKFQKLWEDEDFQQAMRAWVAAWDAARNGTVGQEGVGAATGIVTLMKSVLDGHAPKLDVNGDVVVNAMGNVEYTQFTSMAQIRPYTGDARQEAYDRLMRVMFKPTSMGQGLLDFTDEVYAILKPLLDSTENLIGAYLKASGQRLPAGAMAASRYRLVKSYELALLLAKAALALRKRIPQTSKLFNQAEAIPLFGKCWCHDDGRIPWDTGVSQFIRIFSIEGLPSKAADANFTISQGWPYGLHPYNLDSDPSWWRTTNVATVWASIPIFEPDDPAMSWDAWLYSLVRPSLLHPMPYQFYKFNDGKVVRYTSDDEIKKHPIKLGTVEEGALSLPGAWMQSTGGNYVDASHVTCGFFVSDDVDESPTTVVGALATMMDEFANRNASLEDEIADEVGYSILKGRRPLAACFGIYGRLLGMKGWCFKAMPAAPLSSTSPMAGLIAPVKETFASKYVRIPGSDLWYEIENPKHVVYKHSTFYSSATGMPYTIYHEAMAHETHDRGNEHYDFYVYPTVSISVQELKDSSLGSLRSVDAEGPDGRKWHYITMRNAVPKCPKYVDADRWSVIDLIHEMYLLAWGMSPFCGDNGERLAKLEDVLQQFGVSPPTFIGQLPNDGEDVAADFQIGLFEEYASKIERLIKSVYDLRDQILAVTDAW